MTAFATRTEFDAWARHRLAEMDAGIKAMDAETTRAASPAGGTAMEQARAWRDRFAACIKLADQGADQGHFAVAAGALREAWIQFETEMENWAVAAEQKSTAFDARAKALLGVWHAAAASYKAQALTAAGAPRQDIEAAIARLERGAANYSEKFENLKDAGKLSWVAVGEALKESRLAFEQANDNAAAALAAAQKH